MKWFLGLVVALNLFVGAVLMLRQHDPVDIHSHEVSPEQLKVLPADWRPDAASSAPLAASEPVSASAPMALAQTTSSPLGKAASAPAGVGKTVKPQPAKASEKPNKADSAPVKAIDKPKKAASAPAKVVDKPQKTASAPAHRADKDEAVQCAQWGGLNDALLARVKGGLYSVHLASDQISSQSLEGKAAGNLRYWVYIPTKAVTASLSAELADKGFDNYAVQNEGEYKGALSLGLFGKQDGAQALIDRLKKAGYDKGAILARGKASATRLDFKRLNDTQLHALSALQKRLTPGIALQTVACSR
ncbi:SPOR domain-containing protein [Paludibacterium purpuratum]|uniref:Sporulation related protein n=1 Tax=Paludibacterium purpuratum TaxID=1144873 RepID=A0A4R7B971_9NEIS|nr:SPOR domain-containing protein [Paludibacterium purpuratum]TDR80512.1 hypothetical protein DFP86_1047 [Paludibacterium purpuratum]